MFFQTPIEIDICYLSCDRKAEFIYCVRTVDCTFTFSTSRISPRALAPDGKASVADIVVNLRGSCRV